MLCLLSSFLRCSRFAVASPSSPQAERNGDLLKKKKVIDAEIADLFKAEKWGEADALNKRADAVEAKMKPNEVAYLRLDLVKGCVRYPRTPLCMTGLH